MNEPMADKILGEVFCSLGLRTNEEKYDEIYAVISQLERKNAETKISGGTTGAITERLVEIALEISAKASFFRITSRNFKWVGDFALLGIPFNVIVSVKSFSAKERLLVSGLGSALVPTIGYGWFKDAKEFDNVERLGAYKLRGFSSIYMPSNTYQELHREPRDYQNINGNLLLRKIEDFPSDVGRILETRGGNGPPLVLNPQKL